MDAQKPKVVIIGAGMAGLVAARHLYNSLDLCIVEGGDRIGGRICSSEFGGNQIEMGATWIHGIDGSPIYEIAQENGSLESTKPWERMDGFPQHSLTLAEGGCKVNASVVDTISNLYKKLMQFAHGQLMEEDDCYAIASKASVEAVSIGSFLRRGLELYLADSKQNEEDKKMLEEMLFTFHENMERSFTAAGDLHDLDFNAMREYTTFPGEDITIAKGYSSIIQTIASALPDGLIQLGKKVNKIEWRRDQESNRPVKLHFDDGSTMVADHVIVTVSLGVLKAGIREELGLFSPPLPSFKSEAISRLGFGVVDKLFLQLDPSCDQENMRQVLHLAFQQSDSKAKNGTVPWWMRKAFVIYPLHNKASVLLAWFVGDEALELESLTDDEIINGVSTTISTFLDVSSDGNGSSVENSRGYNFTKVVKSGWGRNPLFRGSYSYVAVGSSGVDLDTMAKPLPSISEEGVPPLQILFAGEATHRTHYSTTHGAYISGVREANRLLQHYHFGEFSDLIDENFPTLSLPFTKTLEAKIH